jgi:VCBS repeat-containing protein
VNDAPVANDDAYSVDEDNTLNVAAPGLLSNDSDVENDPLEAVQFTDVGNGTLNLNADGSFSYTPDANFNGSDSFTYQAYDGAAYSSAATVTITVGPVNDAPVANDDAYSVDEDSTLNVAAPGVLGNDSDAEDDPLQAVLVADVTHGSLSLNSDGSFSYTPDADFSGSGSFTYQAFDGIDYSSVATVTITVDAVNDAPVANDDAYSVDEDNTLNVAAPGLLSNDSDVENDPLTAAQFTDVSNGTLTPNGDGSFSYTPDAGFYGTDSFTYQAYDGVDYSSAATVTITVGPVNDAPVANDDAYSVDEDSTLNVAAPGVLGNDSDAENDPFQAVLVADVTHGSLTLNSDGSFSYTPDADFSGSGSFTYQAYDGTAYSNVATATITVDAVNDAPVANDDAYSVDEDNTLNVAAPGLLSNDSDVENDPLTAAQFTDVSNGTLTPNGDGSFSYTPDAGFNGTDSFTYKAYDGAAYSSAATVTITVGPVNDAPVANDDAYSVDEDSTLNMAAPGVLGNDSDAENDPLQAVLVTDVSHGSLTLDSDGSFSYTPDADFSGSDSFAYQASDGTVYSNTATATITVNGTNDAPLANNDAYSTCEDKTLSVAAPGPLGNDSDADSDSLTAVLASDVGNGTLTLNGNGSFSYLPDSNFSGTDSFTYWAFDGTAYSNVATATITVSAVNDVPAADYDSYSVDEDNTLNVSPPGVLGNDSDAENDPLTAVLVSDVSHGSLTLNSDGSFTYAPAANFSGSDGFTYQAHDGTAYSSVASVMLTVNGANDTPVANDDTYSVDEDNTLDVPAPGVRANDSDADNDGLTAELAKKPKSGSLTLNSNGSFVYTPDANYYGTDSFTYRAYDGTAYSDTATVTITISPVEDATSAKDDNYKVKSGGKLAIAPPGVLANDSDGDGDLLTAVLVQDVSHGLLTLNSDGSFEYMPDPDFHGQDSFTYRADSGESSYLAMANGDDGSDEGTVTIDIERGVPAFPSLAFGIAVALVLGILACLVPRRNDPVAQ